MCVPICKQGSSKQATKQATDRPTDRLAAIGDGVPSTSHSGFLLSPCQLLPFCPKLYSSDRLIAGLSLLRSRMLRVVSITSYQLLLLLLLLRRCPTPAAFLQIHYLLPIYSTAVYQSVIRCRRRRRRRHHHRHHHRHHMCFVLVLFGLLW